MLSSNVYDTELKINHSSAWYSYCFREDILADIIAYFSIDWDDYYICTINCIPWE